jgi:hypothetical protein
MCDNPCKETKERCMKYLLAYPYSICSYFIINKDYDYYNKFTDEDRTKLVERFMDYSEGNRTEIAEYAINHKNFGSLHFARQLIIDNLKKNGPYYFLCMINGYDLTYDDAEKICYNKIQLSRALHIATSDNNFNIIIDYIFDNHMEKYLLSDNIHILSAPVFYGKGIEKQKEHLFKRIMHSHEPHILYWFSNEQTMQKVPNIVRNEYFKANSEYIMNEYRDEAWGKIIKILLPMFEGIELNDEVRTIVLNNYETTKYHLKNKLLRYIKKDKCFDKVNSFFTAKDVLRKLKIN